MPRAAVLLGVRKMIHKIVSVVSKTFKWISGILVGLVVLLNFAAVIMRYVFSKPIAWCEEVSLIMFVAALAFSLVPLTYQRRAVKLDFFTDMMHIGVKYRCKILVDLVCAGALGTTAWLGLDLMKRSKYRMTPILFINYRYIYLIMVIGMAVSALIYVYHLICDISENRLKKIKEEEQL